ncbi:MULTISPECIES: hypothetical protein [unclassified Pseudoalteromonas]|uniref:hypothetical protein n=1 Tax=unclassified Pseudoalteromonas TaxID=194690 RepID=UPI00209682D6|nr:hypothetical protein [Pseudoalteromonas sp. XMcav2-N]MCO7190937.1 hypothetical protein [Pseudoalteromonas sp. XMcav2-N]
MGPIIMGTNYLKKVNFGVLFFCLFSSLNVKASSETGVTDFVVYDYLDGKYEIYVLHPFPARPGKGVLKFHFCGQIYTKGVVDMGTRFKVDACDILKTKSFVELYYVNDGKKEHYETYYAKPCNGNEVDYYIRDNDGGDISFYMSDFKTGVINIIETVDGKVLDRFKTVIGCSYYRTFQLSEKHTEIVVNGVRVRIGGW